MKEFIQAELSRIEAVELVFVEQDEKFFFVTIMIDQPEDAVLGRIIDSQERIMLGLDEYGFDFTVVFRMGREPADVVSRETPVLTRA